MLRSGTFLRSLTRHPGLTGILVLTALFFNIVLPRIASAGIWSSTGSLNTERSKIHTATLLDNGKVLVVGGRDSYDFPVAKAELYDPAKRSWSYTGSLDQERNAHTATRLNSGKVLVVGGEDYLHLRLGSAELYNPATGTWSTTGSLEIERSAHTLTLLVDGKILATGGAHWTTYQDSIAITEVYDPKTGIWSLADPLETARWGQTATLLPNGRILVAGGYHPYLLSLASAELYQPEPIPKAMPWIPLLLLDD
jgi:N-acetylneuraminic acid mutarotase